MEAQSRSTRGSTVQCCGSGRPPRSFSAAAAVAAAAAPRRPDSGRRRGRGRWGQGRRGRLPRRPGTPVPSAPFPAAALSPGADGSPGPHAAVLQECASEAGCARRGRLNAAAAARRSRKRSAEFRPRSILFEPTPCTSCPLSVRWRSSGGRGQACVRGLQCVWTTSFGHATLVSSLLTFVFFEFFL